MSARRASPQRESSGEPELWTGEPATERTISDVETLRALSDPLRLRILEAMVRRASHAWTVKELAATLAVPATRLYHHVDLLVERDLVRPAERRVVQGIIETRYRVAQLSLRLDRGLFSGGTPERAAALHEVLESLFDSARDEVERGIASGVIDTSEDAPTDRRLHLSKGIARLRPEDATEFRARLSALVEEYGEKDGGDEADARPYGLLTVFYPLPEEEHGDG